MFKTIIISIQLQTTFTFLPLVIFTILLRSSTFTSILPPANTSNTKEMYLIRFFLPFFFSPPFSSLAHLENAFHSNSGEPNAAEYEQLIQSTASSNKKAAAASKTNSKVFGISIFKFTKRMRVTKKKKRFWNISINGMQKLKN